MIIKKSKTGIITVKAQSKDDSRHMMKMLIGETAYNRAVADASGKKVKEGKL